MAPGEDYREFVRHPRYGRRPRITGLNPEADNGGRVLLHWHSPRESRIPNTAIPADLSRQSPATVPVSHYYDVKRQCRDCGRPFIFFAEEQKYWYEDLGFALEADCIRCVDCRKKQHGLEQRRERYEALFPITDRTTEQDLDMVDCSLSLIEAAVFHKRQLERLRTILKRLALSPDENTRTRSNEFWARLRALETGDDC